MSLKEITSKIQTTTPRRSLGPILIAVEGYGGSGKTTFANALAKELGDACVISMDDFIVKEKLTELSWDKGGFDRKRLEDQVLKPLKRGEKARYQKLMWTDNSLSDFIESPNTRYVIIEGISSYHPGIAHYYDYKIWIDTPMHIAKERGHARDGSNENAQFWDLWEANDIAYQQKYHPERIADFIFDNEVQNHQPTKS